jgi:hypothetical protein
MLFYDAKRFRKSRRTPLLPSRLAGEMRCVDPNGDYAIEAANPCGYLPAATS